MNIEISSAEAAYRALLIIESIDKSILSEKQNSILFKLEKEIDERQYQRIKNHNTQNGTTFEKALTQYKIEQVEAFLKIIWLGE